MIATIDTAVQALSQGKMIILVDDENRENEGDLCMLAEHVTAQDINFMAHYGCGLICLTITRERAEQLELAPMTPNNTSRFHTGFTVSIEAAQGVTTGISAADRATTIRAAVDPNAKPSDLARPGHMFPIIARDGGVLVRIGQTEGSVDLAKLAGAKVHAGVICEIMKDDGTMARMPDLEIFSQIHQIPIVSIADLVAWRLQRDALVSKVNEAEVTVGFAAGFHAVSFKSAIDSRVHLALCYNLDKIDEMTPLVRVHSGLVWNDMLGINDDNHALSNAIDAIKKHGCGVLLYIHRDADAGNSVADAISNTTPIDEDAVNHISPETRLYGIGAQCLRSLGIHDMILLSDSPKKLAAIEGFGLKITKTQSF